jgi:hypothetical protein
MLMASNVGWNKNFPSGTSSVALGDEEFRSIKSFMQAWWEEEHYATDGSENSAGEHKVGSARGYVGLASQLSNPRKGALFFATDEQKIYVAESDTTWRSYTRWVENEPAARIELVASSANSVVLSAKTSNDTQAEWQVKASGEMAWGPGNGAQDTNLYRQGPGVLATDGEFWASKASVTTLSVGSEASVGQLTVGGGVALGKILSYVTTAQLPVPIAVAPRAVISTLVNLPGSNLTYGDFIVVGYSSLNFSFSANIHESEADKAMVHIENTSESTLTISVEPILWFLVIKPASF